MEKLNLSFIKKYKSKIKKYANILLLLFSCWILVYFCISDNNWGKLTLALPNLNFLWLSFAFFSILISSYFESLVIFEILKFLENKALNRNDFYKITLIGQYFSSLTPMGIGSQPAQTMELLKINIQKDNAVTAITSKFIVYQFMLAAYSWVCSLAYLFVRPSKIILICTAIGLVVQTSFVFLVILFLTKSNYICGLGRSIYKIWKQIPKIGSRADCLKKLKTYLDSISRSLIEILKNKALLIKTLIYSFLQITFLFSVPLFIFKAFNSAPCPAPQLICTGCVANTVCSFTPLPGNSGSSEKSFIILFKKFFSENQIAPAMIIYRIITFYFNIIVGGLVYGINRKYKNNSK